MSSGPYGPEHRPRGPQWSHLVILVLIGLAIAACLLGIPDVKVCCFG